MKIIHIIIILLISVTPAMSQAEQMGRKTAMQRSELITKNLTEKLNLSASQTDSISEVILKREKFRDAGLLSEKKKKETDAEIRKILTKEQNAQWIKHREETRERAKEKNKQKSKTEQPTETE